ncbi:hypothetical protein Aperf_G00000059111 [Anoplocephala perfoliata]
MFVNPNPTTQNFTAQTSVAPPVLARDIPITDPISPQPTATPSLNEQHAKASSLSDIITTLKEWVIVDMKEDGGFKIAGRHAETGRLLSSKKVIFVNNRGNLASDGVQTFILFGPIAWELYAFLLPGADVNPSPDLRIAFSDGFPEKDRKKWLIILFNFLHQALNHGSSGRDERTNDPGTASFHGSAGLDDSFSVVSSVIGRKSDRYEGRRLQDITIVEEDELDSSPTIFDRENSDDFSDQPATKRPCKTSVVVGVQTLPQQTSEKVEMVNTATSPIDFNRVSPLSDWMGSRLDKALSKAYLEPNDERRGELRSVAQDIDEEPRPPNGRPRKKLVRSHPAPSTSRSTQEVAISLDSDDNRKHRPSVKDSSKKKMSAGKNPTTATLGSSSSSSKSRSISNSFFREAFPGYRRFEIEKQNWIKSKIDDRHKLVTLSGIMDVRDLKRTRSGRLSVPTMGTLHRQKIVFDGDDISVTHGEYGKYYSSMIDD